MAAISAFRVTQHSQIFHFSLDIEFNALRFVNYTVPKFCSTYAVATLVERNRSRKRGKFYCCFVNFSKAFDTVNRKYLIYCLIQNRLYGKLPKIIKSIYERVEAVVRINQSITDFPL